VFWCFVSVSFGLERGVIREEFGVLLGFFFLLRRGRCYRVCRQLSFLFLFFTGVSCSSLIDGWVGGCIAVGEIPGSFLLFMVRSYDLAC